MVHGWIFPWTASGVAVMKKAVDPVFNPASRSMKPLRRGLMRRTFLKQSTVLSPHYCSLQLEVWLMRPQYFSRDCLACCWISGRNCMHQFWVLFIFYFFSYTMYQRASVFSRRLHQICYCRSNSIRDSIFVSEVGSNVKYYSTVLWWWNMLEIWLNKLSSIAIQHISIPIATLKCSWCRWYLWWQKSFTELWCFNSVCGRPFLTTAGRGCAPGFLKLFHEKCVCVYVCMYVYLFVFLHPREQTFYLKLESSLYTNKKGLTKPILHSCTGKLCLEGEFLSQSKTGHSDRPQTLKPAFLVDSSGVLQLKNSVLGIMGIQGMCISSFGKWAWPVLMQTKMKSSWRLCWKNFKTITR